MKITLFTSNQLRHNYFINLLSKKCSKLFVVQESKTIFPGEVPWYYPSSKIMKKYFSNVKQAERKIFGNNNIIKSSKKINITPLGSGDLSNCTKKMLKDSLQSDVYIVFGSSFIKGEIANFLSKKKTLNIHMGISPYYRGTDCNFWALRDGNPDLVGATIHFLSKGLDNGPILYHATTKFNKDPFLFTMLSVKSAFLSIIYYLKNKKIKKLKPIKQNNKLLIRYSKKKDFKNSVVKNFFSKKQKIIFKKKSNKLLINPYVLK
jgi:methionyl-tRNA formyltransferase